MILFQIFSKIFPKISAYFRGRFIPGVGLFDFIFPEILAICGVGLFLGPDYLRGNTIGVCFKMPFRKGDILIESIN